MSNPRQQPPAHEKEPELYNFGVELAGMKADQRAVKSDLDALDSRMGNLETQMRSGFNSLNDNLNRMTAPKGAPWPMISVACVLFLALGSWANTYFGQGIAAATKAATVASEQHAILAGRIDLISNRQHSDSLNAARAEGYQEAATKASEKERDRMRVEIDRMQGKTTPAG